MKRFLLSSLLISSFFSYEAQAGALRKILCMTGIFSLGALVKEYRLIQNPEEFKRLKRASKSYAVDRNKLKTLLANKEANPKEIHALFHTISLSDYYNNLPPSLMLEYVALKKLYEARQHINHNWFMQFLKTFGIEEPVKKPEDLSLADSLLEKEKSCPDNN